MYSEVPNNSRGANKSRGVPASWFLILVGVLIKVGVQTSTKIIPSCTPLINCKTTIILSLLDSKANSSMIAGFFFSIAMVIFN